MLKFLDWSCFKSLSSGTCQASCKVWIYCLTFIKQKQYINRYALGHKQDMHLKRHVMIYIIISNMVFLSIHAKVACFCCISSKEFMVSLTNGLTDFSLQNTKLYSWLWSTYVLLEQHQTREYVICISKQETCLV